MTFDKKLNSVDACATSNDWYFRAQTPVIVFWIDWRQHSHEKIKFVYLLSKSHEIPIRANSNLPVLNMGYKLHLLQPKQEVFIHLTYSRTETKNAWKIPLEVMKFVYLHPTYVLFVLIIVLK